MPKTTSVTVNKRGGKVTITSSKGARLHKLAGPGELPEGVTSVEPMVDSPFMVMVPTPTKNIPIAAKDSAGTRLFNPGEAPETLEVPGIGPRAFDYPQSYNWSRPRTQQGKRFTAFQLLRMLGEFDIVRAVINAVVRGIRGMDWGIRVKKQFAKKQGEESPELLKQMDVARQWVHFPDPLGGLDFAGWCGKVLEDLLVIDAVTLTPRYNDKGDPLGLEQIDGSTITPLIDDRGRPPLPPGHAYVQYIKGLPHSKYTTQEMWYLPMNRRTDSPYGRSNTEGVMTTINTSIRSHTFDLDWFVHGNTPDSLLAVPETWTPDQIAQYQTWFDSYFVGRSDRRARLKLVPGGPGTQLMNTKERKWQYDFQEWLGRVIAWNFGVSPMAIAKMVNRSTGEEMTLNALESGLRPVAKYLAAILNRYINFVMRFNMIEFYWLTDETEDDSVAANRVTQFVNAGIMSRDEAREQYDLKPLGGASSMLIMQTTTGNVPVDSLLVGEDEEAIKGIDPSLIQRAFLEVGVITKDELRATIGLDALGPPEGDVLITISPEGAVAPISNNGSGGGNGVSDASEEDVEDGKGIIATISDDEDVEEETTKFLGMYEQELVTFRKWVLNHIKRNTPMDKCRKFTANTIPAPVMKQIEEGLAKAKDKVEVVEVFRHPLAICRKLQ